MKQFVLLFVCLMACATPAYAQGTCEIVNNSTSSEFCNKCSNNVRPARDIINEDRQLSGTLDVDNNSATRVTANVPLGCGEVAPITMGDLNIILGQDDRVVFDPDIQVSAAAVDFEIALKLSVTEASIVFDEVLYTLSGSDGTPSLQMLQDRIRAEAQVLPVDLYYWKAESTPKGVLLKWATRSEIDNDFYSIEYSTDGRNFTEIARVDGKGSSDGVVRYEHLDVPSSGGTHYYRLSQQDFDGTRETFEVRSVTYGSEAAALKSLYPNPARAGQRVSFQAPAHVTEVVLHSITGREIQRSPATNGGIDLPANLPGGIYVLRAGGESTRLLVR